MMNLTQEKLKEIIDVIVSVYGMDGQKGNNEKGIQISDVSLEWLEEHAKEIAPMVNIIDELSNEELTELFVLMMIGRGDMEAEGFQSEYDIQIKSVDEGLADYLIEKAPLAKYLIDGAKKLGFLDY